MKNLLLLIICSAITSVSPAQNVGIGTTNPLYKLHLEDPNTVTLNLQSTVAAGWQKLRLAGDGGQTEFMRHNTDRNATVAGISLNNSTTLLTNGGSMMIGNLTADPVHFISNNILRMKLTGNGQVGINVDNPSAQLHVEANDGNTAIFAINNSYDGTAGIYAKSKAGPSVWGVKSGAETGRSALFDNSNAFNTSPTVEILSNGSGHKLLIDDNSSSVNASLQINSNAANAIRISASHATGGNGLFVENFTTSGSSTGLTSINLKNPGAGESSFGVLSVSGDDGSGVFFTPPTNSGLLAVNLNPAQDFGVYAQSKAQSGAALIGRYIGTGAGNALQLDNGFIKVSGTNKTAFIHTATSGNTTSNVTALSYAGAASSDIVMVTPNYNPNGVTTGYNNHPIGVYWTSGTWTIFNQDLALMPLGTSFNILVIKQ